MSGGEDGTNNFYRYTCPKLCLVHASSALGQSWRAYPTTVWMISHNCSFQGQPMPREATPALWLFRTASPSPMWLVKMRAILKVQRIPVVNIKTVTIFFRVHNPRLGLGLLSLFLDSSWFLPLHRASLQWCTTVELSHFQIEWQPKQQHLSTLSFLLLPWWLLHSLLFQRCMSSHYN